MRNKILTLGAALLMLATWSCREESDALMSYDHNEDLVFGDAEKSFAAKFQILWNGMNQYYAIWDYEKELGIDWDAVYDEYYPQFKALDQKEKVTDDELKTLMDKVFCQLHDGHLQFTATNHTIGSTVVCQPGIERVKLRPDLEQSRQPVSLQYYANVANGEIETDDSGNPIVMEHSTDLNAIISEFGHTPGKGNMWINDKIEELENKPEASRTEMENFQLQQLLDLKETLHQIATTLQGTAFINAFNSMKTQYSFLNIPGFNSIDLGFESNPIDVKFALFKGNIAYFRLNSFQLTYYMVDEEAQKTFDMNNADTQQHLQRVKQVWQAWFDTVQQLHKNGTLGGVIIDLRSNSGGNMNDSQYVVGSLVPEGDIHFGYQRFKRGTGRYDYSTLMPAHVKAMSEPHESITEPVVVLGNCQSISMSESSVLCAKTLPNGTLIGKRTFGAICALIGNDDFSFNYAGYIGVENVTPVFGHVPSMASYTLDKKLIEAEGITPDIEVDLDINLLNTTGQDTQIDRALQFIRTGK